MIDCFVGLGANLGDRMATLAHALEQLAHAEGFALRAVSRAWESEPLGPPQPRYLNAVARVGSMLSPRATLRLLHEIEEKLGRVRREKWGAREIDLDLLIYGDAIARGPIVIPHPGLHQRAFVLGPLRELAPQLVHPALKKSIDALWLELPESSRADARPLGPIRQRLDGPAEEIVEAVPDAAAANPA